MKMTYYHQHFVMIILTHILGTLNLPQRKGEPPTRYMRNGKETEESVPKPPQE